VRWSARWEIGADNRDVHGGLLGLADAELDELAAEGIL
jgi:hypothetical protein